MKRTILCYGDSNTYGYDPQSPWAGGTRPRCAGRISWPLFSRTGRSSIWGERPGGPPPPLGGPAPGGGAEALLPVDAVVILLGSNDLLQMSPPQAEVVVERMRALLAWLLVRRGQWGGQTQFLLSAPPLMRRGAWVADDAWVEASRHLAEQYGALAREQGIAFADGSAWGWSWPLTASTSLRGATWPSPRGWTVRCGPWVCNVYKPALVSARKLRYNERQPGDTSLRTKE